MRERIEDRLILEKFLYRRGEAAYALGLPVAAIDILIMDGRVSTREFEGHVVIPAADVRRVADAIVNGTAPQVALEFQVAKTEPRAEPLPEHRDRERPTKGSPSRYPVLRESIPGEHLWMVNEVAARLKVAPQSVRRWFAEKKLTPTKAGGRTLVSEQDLQAFFTRSGSKMATVAPASQKRKGAANRK